MFFLLAQFGGIGVRYLNNSPKNHLGHVADVANVADVAQLAAVAKKRLSNSFQLALKCFCACCMPPLDRGGGRSSAAGEFEALIDVINKPQVAAASE